MPKKEILTIEQIEANIENYRIRSDGYKKQLPIAESGGEVRKVKFHLTKANRKLGFYRWLLRKRIEKDFHIKHL